MISDRPSGLLVRGLTACALLLVAARTTRAVDVKPDTGSLNAREFSAPELTFSSSHVPLEAVLGELPNRAAWDRFRAERATVAGGSLHVFIDPRSGAATNVMAPIPLLPGDGAGNRIGLADLGARLGRAVTHVEEAVVAQAARQFLQEHSPLVGIDGAEIGALRATRVSETLWQVSAGQVVNGIPVRDARLALTVSHGNVVTFGTEVWGPVNVRTEPAIDAEQALRAGFAHVGGRSRSDVLVQEPRLEIVVTAPAGDRADAVYAGSLGQGYAHRLTWSFVFQRPPAHARWEALVDAESGAVLAFQDTNHYANRQITGGVYPLTNTGQCPTPQNCGAMQPGWPMPFADTGLPAPNHLTNSAGVYDYVGLPPTTTLTGPFVDVFDNCGPLSAGSASGDIDLGGLNGQHDCTVGTGGGAGNTAASRSAFYEVNKLAEQARGWLPGNVWLQSRLVSNVNIALTCNAFWNGSTINFYRSGGGCGNTGEIGAVFDHEWGHGLDDNDANGVLSNSSEGYADIAAIYRLQASCVGHGFSIGSTPGVCGLTADGTGPNRNENQLGGQHCNLDCSGVRDADWDKHADHTPDTALGFVCTQCATGPGPCGRQVHCAAAPARQAAWDLVTRDLTAPPFNLDSQSAFLLGNRIFYQGSGNIGAWHACTCGASSSGCGATNGYIQWLTADDDNGNLNDGTPHMTALFAAFDRHGIACAAPAPVNSGCAAPSAPTLDATAGVYTATLDWSAQPGASRYWVLRSEGHAGCDFGKAKIAEVTGTTFTDTQVAAGRQYAYNVVAQGTSPACSSPVSNCVQVTPTATTDPDFAVSCNPAALTVVQGSAASTICTVSSANAFSSEVSLSCAGLPAGAACTFVPPAVTPAPNGSATSTLTVSAAATTPAGPAAAQVSGTDGTLTRNGSLALSVVAPNFTVACAPSSLSVIQGNAATSTCTIASQNGFNAEVALSCGPLTAGAACSFSPAVVTPPPGGNVTSTLTVGTATTTPGGATAFQAFGTSGALTRSANLTLSVLVPNFTVACVPSSLSVLQGNSVTSTCTIASQNTFGAEVALSCGALPAGAACGFSPPAVTPPPNGTVTSTLTISTSGTTPGGSTSFQALGTSGALVRSANLVLTVQVPSFTVACAPASFSVVQGNSVVSNCTVASQNGFSLPVDLACANLPAGAACSFSATPVTPPAGGSVTSTLTVSTSAATPGGLRTFQVVGTNGALVRSTNLSINVLLPDFTVSCTPASLTTPQGLSAASTCRVTSTNSFNAPVSLSCSASLPAGASCAFSPAEVTPAPNGFVNSTLTVSTSAATPLGTTAFQVSGAGAGLTRSAGLSLNVAAPPDFSVTCSPASLAGSVGGTAASNCTVRSLRSFNAGVSLTCSGLPEGVTCTFNPQVATPPPNGSALSALVVNVGPGVATGSYPFAVNGSSGALTRSAALTLNLTSTVFFDDFETDGGWVANPAGTDTANRGRWERAVPVQYTGGGIVIQNGTTPSGVNDLVTGASTVGSNGDIDNGTTSIQSPPIALPATGVSTLSFAYYLAHRADSSADDFFRAAIVTSSGTTVVFEELGTAVNDAAVFTTRNIDLSPFAGQTVRVHFSAGDGGADNLLEAAVDNVKVAVQ